MCSDQSHGTEGWRERLPGFLMFGSPFLAAAWTAGGIIAFSYFRRLGWNIPDLSAFLVLVNAALASLGSALGGFLSGETLGRQIGHAIGAGALGLWFYFMSGLMVFAAIVIVQSIIFLFFGFG